MSPPQALIEVYATDWPRLGESGLNSLKLLAIGVVYACSGPGYWLWRRWRKVPDAAP